MKDHITWFTRIAVGSVFIMNVSCALSFLIQPEKYSPGFEFGGLQGQIMVQAFGILFLMWNATYPPVLLEPKKQMTLFTVILVQQAIGLIGETWLFLNLPPGHPALWNTGMRFILFDALGLLIMAIPYMLLRRRHTQFLYR